ncbi:MAG: isocitrate lyase/phosphoenolpyruvate mutase family protein [Xanthomonadales bacterium]|nr:isocitrate lyase/phosphoenolpyruvate mutase family protein [Xanthomonadales bacterium]
MSQLEKARTFFALHQSGTFIMPNAWDAGSAKILAAHGFKALGTTSGGFAFGLGRPDALSAVSLDEALGNIAEIAAAVDIPVSADFENGYADDPADVADNVRRCVAAGAAGCSIEDWTGDTERGFYEEDLAVERVAAAVEAAGDALVVTARCEALLYRHPGGFAMALQRLKRFAEVGAPCVYAPGVVDRAQIAMLAQEAGAPVNQLVGLQGAGATVDQMTELGVRRLSVGGSLMRATIGPLIAAAQEMRDDGTFTFVDDAPSGGQILKLFEAYY